jgi:hypothetical protein
MELTWKVFIPLALANLLAVMSVLQLGLSPGWLLPISIGLFALSAMIAALAKRADIRRRRRASLATA